MKVIFIYLEKGGVLKSSIVYAISTLLSMKNKKTDGIGFFIKPSNVSIFS